MPQLSGYGVNRPFARAVDNLNELWYVCTALYPGWWKYEMNLQMLHRLPSSSGFLAPWDRSPTSTSWLLLVHFLWVAGEWRPFPSFLICYRVRPLTSSSIGQDSRDAQHVINQAHNLVSLSLTNIHLPPQVPSHLIHYFSFIPFELFNEYWNWITSPPPPFVQPPCNPPLNLNW
jgi:hypothetical protein